MATQFTVSARLTAKDEASPKIKAAEGTFQKFGSFLRNGLVAAFRAVEVGVVAMGAALVKAVGAAQQQEDAVNSLNAALAGLGDRSALVSKALQEQAAALQQVSRFGDEQIISAQALLATFGVQADQMQAATQATVDLAAAFGQSLEQAARNVGKTVGGFAGELGEIIPQLKDLSAESLKAGEGIQVIGDVVAGRAQADVKTFSGALAQLRNTIGDLAEKIGGAVTENDQFKESIAGLNQTLSSGETEAKIRRLADAIATLQSIAIEIPSVFATAGDVIGQVAGGIETVEKLHRTGLAMAALEATADRLGISVTELRNRIELGAQATRDMNEELRETESAADSAVDGVTNLADVMTRSERITRENTNALAGFVDQVAALGVTLEEEANREIEKNNELLEKSEDLYRRGLITRQDFEAIERKVAETNQEVTDSLREQNEEFDRLSDVTRDAGRGMEEFASSTVRSTQALRDNQRAAQENADANSRFAPNLLGGRSTFATIGGGTFTVSSGGTQRSAGGVPRTGGVNRV